MLGLELDLGAALVQEAAFELVEVALVGGGPVERRGEPGAAVELAGVAAARLPVACSVDQVLVQAPPLGVLLEPAAQAGPLAQQSLVRDLDGSLICGHEPAVGQGGQRSCGGVVALGVEFLQRHAAAHERGLRLAGVGQPQQDPPRGDALWLGQLRVGRLGEAAHGAAHTAGALVRGPAHHAAVALLPLLEQCRRQQGQAAWLIRNVGDEGIGKRGLHAQPDPAGGFDDRSLQLVPAHRADEHLVRSDKPGKPVVGGAAPVEVGAHGDHHLNLPVAILRQTHKRVQEVRALLLVAAEREHLLELVDDQYRPLAALWQHPLQRGQRVLARAHQPSAPAPGSGQHARGQRRQQARPDCRGLSASGWPDHGQERRAH